MAAKHFWQRIRDWFDRTGRVELQSVGERAGRSKAQARGEIVGRFAEAGRGAARALAVAEADSFADAMVDGTTDDMTGHSAEEVTEEELLDFLAADLDPVPADPVFRERLRDELWEFVEDGRAARNDH